MIRPVRRTLVTFHAHPDDEAISTAGVMAQAAAAGDRVVLVVATGGEVGEVPDGFLSPGETLGERRRAETERAAALLGVERGEFLGFHDSGMMGESTNDEPGCFWKADRDEAARRLAGILVEESAGVLTVYDANGGYGHPDHIQVHRVGVEAAARAGTPVVLEATINRDSMIELLTNVPPELRGELDMPEPAEIDMGVPGHLITTTIDVSPWVGLKREAMRAHASQIPADSLFLQLPDEAFTAAFGTEWFIRRGAAPGTRESTLPWATS
ncbi:MAG: PIG-L family deacetylase [Acidimicrobiia bacterium]|nr:PIG-L family deacetylase [Acidimicrobiia bacterium]